MTITQLQETKKGRFSVFVDGEFLFSVHKDTFLTRQELALGRQITVEALEEIRLADELLSCKEKALTLLEYSSHSAGRLADLLNLRGYSLGRVRQELYRRRLDPETIQEVMDSLGDVDQIGPIVALVRKKYLQKLREPQGRGKVAAALQRRGYQYDEIREALALVLEELPDEDEEEGEE